MKTNILLAALCLGLVAPHDVFAIGRGGGHGGFAGGSGRPMGGGGRGGFGGGEAMHRTPSMSGFSGQANRPDFRTAGGGGMVPHGAPGGGRPGNIKEQPFSGNRFAGRPNFEGTQGGFNRPGAGGGGERSPGAGNRPNWENRPGAGGGGEQWAGGGNRPNWGNRPGAGGGGEQWSGNRPNWPSRPGQGGGGERWPGERGPGGGQRPNWPNQPGQGGIANRNNFGDRTNVFANNSNIGNRTNIGNQTNFNRGNQDININNTNNNVNNISGNHNWNGQGNWNNNWPGAHNYWNNHYANWHQGNWNNWNYHPAAWYGAGMATGWLASPGDAYVYSNPFYVAPAAVSYNASVPSDASYNYVDYSQPIVQPPQQASMNYGDNYAADYDASAAGNYPPATYADPSSTQQAASAGPASGGDDAPPEAFQRFDAARAAFKANEYRKALAEVDHAIKLLPSDATMHEFRALVLFAQGKYRDAAAGIYAVLSMGPGWTWETMNSLYATPETYTRQLRELESYCRKNPDASDGHFLLGYHYLVMNHVPEGVKQLNRFVALVPQDKLAPQLIKAFSAAPNSQSTAELPQTQPVNAEGAP
jgi:hypothetical protein